MICFLQLLVGHAQAEIATSADGEAAEVAE